MPTWYAKYILCNMLVSDNLLGKDSFLSVSLLNRQLLVVLNSSFWLTTLQIRFLETLTKDKWPQRITSLHTI